MPRHGAPDHVPPPLRGDRALFLSITLLVTVAMLVVGVFASLTGRDRLLGAMTFGITVFGLVLAFIQAYPNTRERIRGAVRLFTYFLVVAFAAVSLPAIWVVLQPPVIYIAVSLPLTDDNRQDALPILQAARLALAHENGSLSAYRVDLLPIDDVDSDTGAIGFDNLDGGDTGRHGTFAHDIVDDARVLGVIGPFNSGTALEWLPLSDPAGLAMISPANTRDCLTAKRCGSHPTNQHGSYFRVAVPDRIRAAWLAERFTDWEKSRKTETHPDLESGTPDKLRSVVFVDQSTFGAGFAADFIRRWRELNRQSPPPDIVNVTAGNADQEVGSALQGKSGPPDVVLLAGTGDVSVSVFKAVAANRGYDGADFVGAATIMNKSFTDVLSEGLGTHQVYAISPAPYPGSQATTVSNYQEFRHKFQATYEAWPTPYATLGYDATLVLLKAVELALQKVHPATTYWDPISRRRSNELRAAILENIHNFNVDKGMKDVGTTNDFYFDDEKNGDVTYRVNPPIATVSLYHYSSSAKDWSPSRGVSSPTG